MAEGQTCIALVAGEASGDQLGAALIERLKQDHPDARFVGIGGGLMREQGMETWWDCEELAVFGLFEVLSHFPRLLRLRRELKQRILDSRPDVFIGIDAPDFNLGLEIQLRRSGIRTVHYVSPTVWAWREKRVHKIARAADQVLCLFPFEPAFYSGHGVAATYVGHPMADRIALENPQLPARERLGLPAQGTVVALLPGSRSGEVTRLAGPMLEAAGQLASSHDDIRFVAAMAGEKVKSIFQAAMQTAGFKNVELIDKQSRDVMAAANVVITASGTATLETMLINRPMVVVYKLAPSTYRLAKTLNLVRQKYFSLPNILAGEPLVPELIQDDANAPAIAGAVADWLKASDKRHALERRFSAMHRELACDAAGKAAKAVSGLITTPAGRPDST